jgi:hypothetical protein
MNQTDYIEKLENSIKQFLQPVKNIPLNLVIEALSNKKVLEYDEKNREHISVLKKIIKAAENSAQEINKKGIPRLRPNEVGNNIENFVKESLRKLKIKVETPSTPYQKKKATGYPDILFWFKEKPYYLECKTFNIKNISTSQRSFYLSPSSDFKVIYDTIHFCLSFVIYSLRKNYTSIYKCRSFKVLSLEKLSMDIKHEFNSDNKRLYSNQDGAKILFEKFL